MKFSLFLLTTILLFFPPTTFFSQNPALPTPIASVEYRQETAPPVERKASKKKKKRQLKKRLRKKGQKKHPTQTNSPRKWVPIFLGTIEIITN